MSQCPHCGGQKEQLVNAGPGSWVFVPCPFWATSDFDIPVELWKERLGAAVASVAIAPGLEHNARPWPGGKPVGTLPPGVFSTIKRPKLSIDVCPA